MRAETDTQDGDGKLSLTEFVVHMHGTSEGLEVADWDSAGLQFRQFRDHNKDGFIDKDELMVGLECRLFQTVELILTIGLDTSPGV